MDSRKDYNFLLKSDMNELRFVQHNDLIESSYRLAIDEMRLLIIALTKINSCKANAGTIEIYPDEFSKLFNLNKKNIWRHMKKSLMSIMTKPVCIKFIDDKKKEREKLIFWLDTAEYYTKQSDGSKIELKFTADISHYLFELKGNFTIINLEDACKLKNPFSLRLYQWLAQEFRMKSGGYYELTIPLETIKNRAFEKKNAYPEWRDFKSRVIQPAVDAINQTTNLSVNYNSITRGNKAHTLIFTYIDELQKSTKRLKRGSSCILPAVKPVRPRLMRRPRVKAGSHEEGEWQKKNLKILSTYLNDLKAWDPASKLSMADLKKIVSYSKIFDPVLHKKMYSEQLQRQKALRLSNSTAVQQCNNAPLDVDENLLTAYVHRGSSKRLKQSQTTSL